MAQELHRLRRPLWQAAFIVLGLLVWSFYLAFAWILALPPLLQVLLGTALGFTSMASYSNTQMQRSQVRRRTSVNLAQLSLADILALRKLLSNNEKALSWLPGPSDAELARWINAGLEKVWPFLKEASSGVIKVKLEKAYNNYKAGGIERVAIKKINLGNCCPFIEGLKFVPGNKDNQCSLEVELDWRQNENQDMVLDVSSLGTEFVVQVRNFVVYCVLRFTFTPLVWELPGFAAVVVSIIEPPLVDFQTKLISGDVKKVLGMEKAVDNMLLSALMDILVWPGRVVLPILPGDYSDLEASCVGHLHVQLVEARDLANRDIVGRSDPYVMLFLRRRNDLIKQSEKRHDTTEPVWNEEFSFNVEDLQVQKLTIKLMNVNEADLDVFVGISELSINQLKANVKEELWIDLVGDPEKLHGRFAGEIHLLLEFKPKYQTSDLSDASNWAAGAIAPTALLNSEPDGSLRTHGDGSQCLTENVRVDDALNRGLGVILEGDNRGNKYRFSSISCGNTDFSNDEIQVLPGSMADREVEPHKYMRSGQKLSRPEERTRPVRGCSSQPVDEAGAASFDFLNISESDSRPHMPFAGDESGSEVAITENHKDNNCVLPGVNDGSIEMGCESCIVDDNENHDDHIYKAAVNQLNRGKSREIQYQPDLLVAGDPAWGLNGLLLQHCDTSSIPEDMFSSEIFEVD